MLSESAVTVMHQLDNLQIVNETGNLLPPPGGLHSAACSVVMISSGTLCIVPQEHKSAGQRFCQPGSFCGTVMCP